MHLEPRIVRCQPEPDHQRLGVVGQQRTQGSTERAVAFFCRTHEQLETVDCRPQRRVQRVRVPGHAAGDRHAGQHDFVDPDRGAGCGRRGIEKIPQSRCEANRAGLRLAALESHGIDVQRVVPEAAEPDRQRDALDEDRTAVRQFQDDRIEPHRVRTDRLDPYIAYLDVAAAQGGPCDFESDRVAIQVDEKPDGCNQQQ